MLTGKQRRFLRSRAHHLSAVFQVGKCGVTDRLTEHLNTVLEAHELVKVNILQSCEEDRYDVAERLATATGAELVQILGKTVVFYRRSSEKPKIELP
ncbi:MAG: ribosome assembly RNA-binding protein YhbY [Acidobacteriota bacterium]|nr:ribosome assembly RNA-binding protein YhbY [Blastocatellia bacterium]MDW8412245.1 ribosome assembly RNA-binding protein YhbY [Acidobacteriota bacterium]